MHIYFILYFCANLGYSQFGNFDFGTTESGSGFPGFPTESGSGFPGFPSISSTPEPTAPTSPTPQPTIDPSEPHATGWIGIGQAAEPIGVCFSGKQAGKDISAKYTCSDDGNSVAFSEWGNSACSGSPTLTIAQFASKGGFMGMGISLIDFDCTVSVNYWSGRVWGNDTGTCAQNDNYWKEAGIVVNLCTSLFGSSMTSMMGNTFGNLMPQSALIDECSDCGCHQSLFTDKECQSLFTEDASFGNTMCYDDHCWTADPDKCGETLICPKTSAPKTKTYTPAPTYQYDTTCADNMDDCGWLVFGLLASPLNVCLAGKANGKSVSMMYQCTTDKQSIQFVEWQDTSECEGDASSTISFGGALSFSCSDKIPPYFKSKVYSNNTKCYQDEDNWVDQAMVTDHCFGVGATVGDTDVGMSVKFTDCAACSCTTTIYQDGTCGSVLISSTDSAPFCDDTNHCVFSAQGCDGQVCSNGGSKGSESAIRGTGGTGSSGGDSRSASASNGKGGSGVLIAIVVVLVVFLMAGGIGFYFYRKNRQKPDDYALMETLNPQQAP